jgi:hypothetical protein
MVVTTKMYNPNMKVEILAIRTRKQPAGQPDSSCANAR